MSTTQYRILRRIILYGKRTKHRVAALTDLIGSPTPPSVRLLNELLSQKDLPDELALTCLSLKRTYYGKGVELPPAKPIDWTPKPTPVQTEREPHVNSCLGLPGMPTYTKDWST